MYCAGCGQTLAEGNRFCRACGRMATDLLQQGKTAGRQGFIPQALSMAGQAARANLKYSVA